MVVEAKTATLSLPQLENKSITPRPEDIFSPTEIELLYKAENGEIPCPCCGQPLEGDKVILEGIYEGILLSCPDVVKCGYLEL